MFENVPTQLTEWVRELPDELRNRDIRYTVAASLVVRFYLGHNAFADECNPFLKVEGDYKSHLRVTQVGEVLFLLRTQPGFNEIVRRLSTRDMRSAFYEASAARIFFTQGFQIHMRPETGVRTADFDFQAVQSGEIINVEITGLTGAEFSSANILNALRKKRKQLPNDRPSVIGCFFPQEWNAPGIREAIEEAARRFLRGTSRITYLGYLQELFEQRGSGGFVMLMGHWIRNERCRHPSRMLDGALAAQIPHEEEMRRIALGQEEPISTGFTDFISWVDWAVS